MHLVGGVISGTRRSQEMSMSRKLILANKVKYEDYGYIHNKCEGNFQVIDVNRSKVLFYALISEICDKWYKMFSRKDVQDVLKKGCTRCSQRMYKMFSRKDVQDVLKKGCTRCSQEGMYKMFSKTRDQNS
ncbi:hypothetical protein CDAR_531131 [Caerostris darwini]|uniref:Uncharacterized protein n=1 Tax=Caerostris darwini TaxID=1538125 RepID=A0AAV4Q6X8_9ARAC|nr:hypothetical protein CDAR_531131 [Caerostris darwini]